MAAEERKIKLEQKIQAKPERVFAALTEASRLQEWLCDRARSEPRVGGRYSLRWNSGYEVQGSFVELDSPEELTMVWQGLGEPCPTVVEWELEEDDDGTEVTLEHTGFGSGPPWDRVYAEAEKSWKMALEGLQSALEEGVDLRYMRRPILGVFAEDMSAERAEREGIAVKTGIYINDFLGRSAAEEAGLQRGDVVVAVGGHAVVDNVTVDVEVQTANIGDTVELEVVRGQERLTVPVTLKGREPLDVPDDPKEAAARMRERHTQLNAELVEATAGLSEAEAGQQPAEGEWSVKEVLAHLTMGQRGFQQYIELVVQGVQIDGGGGPWPDRMAATLAAEPTLAGLLARFARDQEETAILIEHLSERTRADRYRCRRIIEGAMYYSNRHTEEHVGQIRRAVEAVRGQAD